MFIVAVMSLKSSLVTSDGPAAHKVGEAEADGPLSQREQLYLKVMSEGTVDQSSAMGCTHRC